MRPDLFLLGGTQYRVAAADATAGMELIRREQLSPKGVKRVRKSGDLLFYLGSGAAQRFEAAARAEKITFFKQKTGGVPTLLCSLRKRPGLLLGMLVAVALLIGARLFVWDIRFTEASQIPYEELEEELALAGLYRGRFLPGLDRDEMAFSMRLADKRLGFVSINLKGTVAYVQIRESEPQPPEKSAEPANLVAARDGVITTPLIFEGECLVAPGDVVRAGDLLASGMIDTQNHGYRVTRSAGQVFAKTVREYRISVPYAYEEKYQVNAKTTEFSLLFFNFKQKVFKSTGNHSNNCDIIKEIVWFTLPGGMRLPFGYSKTAAQEYTSLMRTRTATEARALALAQLEQRLAEDLPQGKLLQKNVEVCAGDGEIVVLCTAICEEDIAITSEFSIQP